MSVIIPILNESYYKLDLDQVQTDSKLIFKTWDIIKSESNSKKIIRKIIQLIKTSNNIGVFDILINILDYSVWIAWFEDCNVLKYYWDDSLIKRIIDTNKNKIYSEIFLDSNACIDTHLISLTDSYVLNYNYTKDVLKKRVQNLINLIGMFVENFVLDDYLGCENLMFILGNNLINKNFNQLTQQSVVITFYPVKSSKIKLVPQSQYVSTDDAVLFKIGNLIIKFDKYIYNKINIFSKSNGYIDFENYELKANAELYQKFNSNLNNYLFTLDTYQYNQDIKYFDIVTKSDDYTLIKLYKTLSIANLIRQSFPKCYDCKKVYDGYCLPDYQSHCLPCGIKNFRYRIEKANLSGLTFFITGIRVKIGFATALRLLRAGASIIGTTRYTSFALFNYSKEPDYEQFKSRLIIIHADFLSIESVYTMLKLLDKYQINGFINMAFRTIRPSEHYDQTVKELESELQSNITIKDTELNQLRVFRPNTNNYYTKLSEINTSKLKVYKPDVLINVFGDVQDIEHESSWTQSIEELDPKEIVECFALNQLVPTLLINKLKGKLIGPKFIITVDSYEGKFSTGKTNKHVHTNMCKSALNMLIRSLEEDPDPELHVHTINPGYVSGVNPQKSIYPVSLEDSATKITWPIYQFVLGTPLDKSWTKICNYEKDTW